MDFPEVFILRHGETHWNAEGRLHGTFDAPLSDLGLAQARAQRAILAGLPIAGLDVFLSPQPRVVHTAEVALAGHGRPMIQDSALLEIGIGAWAGQRIRDLPITLAPGEGEESLLPIYDAAPGGEGFAGLQRRCQRFLDNLQAPAVIVTHGITSRMLRLSILGMNLGEISKIDGGQGVVFQIKDGVQIKHAFGA